MSLSETFRPLSYKQLPGWPEKGLSAAFTAFARSARYALQRPYRSGSLGVSSSAFKPAFEKAVSFQEPVNDRQAQSFFEHYFLPYHVRPEPAASGFVTGYYEPEAEASPVRTEKYLVPLYCRPDDLLELDDGNRPAHIDPQFAFARRDGDRIVPYQDREAIDKGALSGRHLELCWLANRVDAFFIHVQGAARLVLTNGKTMRVTYAAKSGHPFTGIGRVLADLGEIPLRDVTMQSIRAWLADNPDRLDEILWRNRSYIFFRETDLGDPALGPVAAAKVQLQPGRSIAVDRLLHTFGTPFFIDAPGLLEFDGQPVRRLMIAQDTGSAITGAARGDLFIGTGAAAGEIAGVIRHAADFYALLPRSLGAALR